MDRLHHGISKNTFLIQILVIAAFIRTGFTCGRTMTGDNLTFKFKKHTAAATYDQNTIATYKVRSKIECIAACSTNRLCYVVVFQTTTITRKDCILLKTIASPWNLDPNEWVTLTYVRNYLKENV